MMEEEPLNNVKKEKEMIHYQKINIFGEPGVGKSSLISYLENYENDNFVIKDQKEFKENLEIISINNEPSSLVEQIKKIKIELNEDRNLYLNIYETNIDRYDSIKKNLETLLFQTECIIIMWDNDVRTFEIINQLINNIKYCLKNINDRNVPFILLQNKNDLLLNQDIDNDNDIDIDKSIEEIQKENSNIIYRKISLLNKNDFYTILLEIDRSIDRTNVENKKDAIDLVEVDYPIKQLKDERKKFNIIKIALLGDSNTGKTSFINILNGKSIDDMVSTIGIDSVYFYAYIKNEKYKIKIVDTAGQENYRSIAISYIKDMDGFLLFIDVTKKDSFNSIDYWKKFINENNLSKQILLLGNKIDESEKRDTKKAEVKEYAENNNIKYIECSCKDQINIYEILNEIILMSFYRYQEKENSIERISLNNNQENLGWCPC